MEIYWILHKFAPMESMNEKIKQLRKLKGVSQVEVANAAGINQSSYASIENGNTKSITIDVGIGIAKALGTSFNELFEIDGTNSAIDELNRQIEELQGRIEELKNISAEKSLLIETLKNEQSHIKEHLVMQMLSSYAFEIRTYDEQILKSENEEKEKLTKKKEDIINRFNFNKNYYIRTGFITQSDFDDHYKEMENIYPVIPGIKLDITLVPELIDQLKSETIRILHEEFDKKK